MNIFWLLGITVTENLVRASCRATLTNFPVTDTGMCHVVPSVTSIANSTVADSSHSVLCPILYMAITKIRWLLELINFAAFRCFEEERLSVMLHIL